MPQSHNNNGKRWKNGSTWILNYHVFEGVVIFWGVDWFLCTVNVMYCKSVGVFSRFHGVNCMVLVRTPAILVNHTRCMVIWCYMEVLCYCPYCLPGFESILNIEDRWFFSVTFWCATLRMYLRTATFQSKRLAPWLLELWALNSSRCVTSMFWFSKATYTKTAELLMPDWVWLSFSPMDFNGRNLGGPQGPHFQGRPCCSVIFPADANGLRPCFDPYYSCRVNISYVK